MASNPATKDFMGKPAPPGYIAGLGRGATGFTTRSDIGPAREATLAALQKGKEAEGGGGEGDGADEQRFADDPDNETGLFNSLPYEADDEEADAIYAAVDEAMASRRAKQRAIREAELKKKLVVERPKLSDQFADAKRELGKVSAAEWDAIPEAANLSRRKTKKDLGRERFVPVPDSILAGARAMVETSSTVVEGTATAASSGMRTDFVLMGEARDRVLGVKLDQVSDSVSGKTVVDPKGYLTDMGSLGVKSESEIGDIKKARLLLKSVTTTNRGHAPGWIAAARLEEIAGKLAQARALIAQGCEECSKSEDVWLEAARLNSVENAKVILAKAVRHLPTSVKIWLHASKLEQDPLASKRVVRRALEFIPHSVTLWKTAISLEDNPADAVILLKRAVECVPLSVEMWLTLAKLESYDNARKVINKARKTIPASHEIWIAAAMLEEANGNEKNVSMIIEKAIQSLGQQGHELSRERWLEEAVECEKNEALATCRAIVVQTIGLGLEPQDYKIVWLQDAETCASRGNYETARSIYQHAVWLLPKKRSVWQAAAFHELDHGTTESLLALLDRAVVQVPHAETLWLMAAKKRWESNNLEGARDTLASAFRANPTSSEIWLAAVKLEQETGEYTRAQVFLARARVQAGGEPRVWMKSAVLERIMGNLDAAVDLVRQAAEKFPTFWKLWLVWAQIEEQRGDIATARDVYMMAMKHAPKSIAVWIEASRLEERAGIAFKSRSILERARLINPKTPDLWHETIALEHRTGNKTVAAAQLARALQECPTSGRVHSQAILLASRPERKARCTDAIKACGESDPHVVLAVARTFWADRKLDKARAWLERATRADPDWGDAWGYWLRFEVENGDADTQAGVVQGCLAAAPKHGDLWPTVAKDVVRGKRTVEEVLAVVAKDLVST
ncbi:PRP1 splicing factor, N-terminal-domain-containing protein [Blastocladiella britannica]|nr:PRP1 splicing factor, N-terminal-domain-containing protein [Blastocladiella britannica]